MQRVSTLPPLPLYSLKHASLLVAHQDQHPRRAARAAVEVQALALTRRTGGGEVVGTRCINSAAIRAQPVGSTWAPQDMDQAYRVPTHVRYRDVGGKAVSTKTTVAARASQHSSALIGECLWPQIHPLLCPRAFDLKGLWEPFWLLTSKHHRHQCLCASECHSHTMPIHAH